LCRIQTIGAPNVATSVFAALPFSTNSIIFPIDRDSQKQLNDIVADIVEVNRVGVDRFGLYCVVINGRQVSEDAPLGKRSPIFGAFVPLLTFQNGN
jgi:hypothetical protein